MSQRGSRKSRSGCIACKSKRIKCDETKPQCVMCTSQRQRCPGYQQPFKWSTKHEVNLNHKKSNARFLSCSSEASIENWPDIDDRTSSPDTGRREAEQQTWFSTAFIDENEDVEITAAGGWDLSDQFIRGHPTEHATDGHTEMTLDVDLWLPGQDLGESTLWMDDSQWLDDFQSFDTFSNFYMNSNTDMTSIAPPVDEPLPDQSEEEFLVKTQDQEPISATPPHPDHESTSQAISQTAVRLYQASAPQTLTHIPTFLIDYWFHTVCAAWNSFDSVKNLNRSVALESFPHSEGLAYSLQSMAAAYLAEHLPHFREITITMTQAAVHAIRRELSTRISPHALPRHLLLSMFCIGTSACWTDPLQFGLPFLKEIKAILRSYNPSRTFLSPDDQNALNFFNNSTLYWDMLCSIVGAEDTDTIDPLTPSSPMPSPRWKDQDVLHPWTGVSIGILELFFQSILLCRAFRIRMTQDHRQTSRSLRAALQDIEEAKKLHQRLEFFSIPNEQQIGDTGDELTPKRHLIQIAEAYRLAALAHLRQTFSDLTSERTSQTGDDTVDADYRVLSLGLEIIRILEKIPLASGTRCIQPLLCLTAGTVLKLDTASVEPQQHTLALLNDILSTDLRSAPTTTIHDSQYEEFQRDASATLDVTRRSIEVGQGRRFVLERLSILEGSLPPKPIRVVRQLVQTVWAAYDSQGPGGNQVHWIDIMAQSNLRTIFG